MKTNIKEEILNTASDTSLKGRTVQMTDFLAETMESRGNVLLFLRAVKKLLIENSVFSENILDENHNVLR